MMKSSFSIRSLIGAASLVLLVGCVQPTRPDAAPQAVAPPPPPAQAPAAAPTPTPDVYFYPQQGQSAQQQARDRYECYLWARQKTGYDPSRYRPDSGSNLRVVAVPGPGHDTVAGGFTGAVLGAAVSGPQRLSSQGGVERRAASGIAMGSRVTLRNMAFTNPEAEAFPEMCASPTDWSTAACGGMRSR